jgi:uncharacterized SAM-binding protein YcdF (DUF218 family)
MARDWIALKRVHPVLAVKVALLVGSIFVVGFLLRWRHTPFATITVYATLATLCFIETVDFGAFGGGPGRYVIMAAEYAVYVILSIYLLRSRRIWERFQPVQPVAAPPPER